MDYAVGLVKRGFITFAPDRAGYGQRRVNMTTNVRKEMNAYSKILKSRYKNWDINGKSIYDLKIALDYVLELPFVDKESIGIMGHSLGSWDSLMFAALDERVKATVCNSGGMLQFNAELWNSSSFLEKYLTGNKNGGLQTNTNIFIRKFFINIII